MTEEGHSTGESGEILGVSHGTVHNAVKKLTGGEERKQEPPEPIDVVAALAVTNGSKKEVLAAAKEIRAEHADEKRAKRTPQPLRQRR